MAVAAGVYGVRPRQVCTVAGAQGLIRRANYLHEMTILVRARRTAVAKSGKTAARGSLYQ